MNSPAASPKRYTDLQIADLIELALTNSEGYLSDTGAFCTTTGERTGRSPLDCFVVKESSTSDLIDWSKTNRPFEPEQFNALWEKAEDKILQTDHYVNHLEIGDHPDYSIPVEVTTQTAWHSLCARNLLLCPEHFNAKGKQKWKVLHAPNVHCHPSEDGTRSDAAMVINFAKRKVLLVGMSYAGELKKALFSVQSFLLPEKDVLPLHCSANVGENNDVCLFFGVSGTGKTTLCTQPDRNILGDDEHGWSKESVFNLEGGVYAKTIGLSAECDPIIWEAIRFGTVLENVVHTSYTRTPNYNDTHHSENGRCCFPISHISAHSAPSPSKEPKYLIFLSCDVLGVLPPVSRLSPRAAAYHFLSGYTARVGSVEVGGSDSMTPVFSSCYGSPFMLRPAEDYARLLLKRIKTTGCKVYLLNTGWAGGPAGIGQRFDLSVTRQLVSAIQSGALDNTEYTRLNQLNLDIPLEIPGSENPIPTNPVEYWSSATDFEDAKKQLIEKFLENMKRFSVKDKTIAAGPSLS